MLVSYSEEMFIHESMLTGAREMTRGGSIVVWSGGGEEWCVV